jgi:glycosyltransferase involved in cell wall biosynthesis
MKRLDQPLVSIGMPAYNGDQYIRKALDALLNQSYENFELIISDNASTDLTSQICAEYSAKDQRVKVYTQETNIGAVRNFQYVLEKAQGAYFMWAAVDDDWMPDFIREMVNELESNPEAGVAMSAVDRVYPNGELLDTIRFLGKDNPNDQTYYQMLKRLISGKKYNLFIYGLFRTDLLKKAIPNLPNVTGSDRLFICQLALGTRFRYVNQLLHIRTNHIIPSKIRLPNEKFNAMEKNKFVNIIILYALARMILRSQIIPWYRKFYLPIAVWRYALLLYIPPIKAKLKYHFPQMWNFLKKNKRFLTLGRDMQF